MEVQRCSLGLLLLAAASLSSALAAQVPGGAGVVEIVTIEIPARVIDSKGAAVRGLTANSFEIREGKQKLEIIRVETIDLTATPAGGGRPWSAPVPAAARRRFLFVFDLSFSSMAALARARSGVLAMLDGGRLHPSDLVGVASYSASKGVEMVLGLTTDHRQARVAIESLGMVDSVFEANDPLRLVLVDLENALGTKFILGSDSESLADRPGFAPVDKEQEILLHLTDIANEQSKVVRNERTRPVLAMVSALTGLAEHLASIPGYKQVVFLSAGFDSSFLHGTSDLGRLADLAQARPTTDSFQVDSEELFGASNVRSVLLSMTEAFRRADCSIHAVDIGGLRAAGDVLGATLAATSARAVGASEEGLFIMANETGGRFVRSQNDLGAAMEKVLEQTAMSYVLVLQPSNMMLDGTYHEVEVKLRKGPKGARVLHRPGYYSPRPYGTEKGEARRFQAADLLAAGEDGGRVATGLLASSFPGESGRADVVAWVEMYGDGLLNGNPGDRMPLEVYVYAFHQDGRIADFATHAVMIDLVQNRYALEYQGFKHVLRLALEPGRYHLRVLVRNAVTGATGLRTRSIEVPDFEAAVPRLSPPFFIEPEGLWLVGWGQDLEGGGEDYPLNDSNGRLLPATDPVVPRGVEIPLLLLGFGFSAAPDGLRAELQPPGGGDPLSAGITLDGFEADGGGGLLWARIKVATVLPPGRYELKISADDGGQRAESSIPVFVQ